MVTEDIAPRLEVCVSCAERQPVAARVANGPICPECKWQLVRVGERSRAYRADRRKSREATRTLMETTA